MVTKNQLKEILKLKQKKQRIAQGLFVAEGEKTVGEFLNASWPFKGLFTTGNYSHSKAIQITQTEMNEITHFKNSSPILGIFEIPKPKIIKETPITIVLDSVADPGNLGNIIRLCDWYGINQLICSYNTVDCFNSKTVQASMGSLARVTCNYKKDISKYLESLRKPVYGADSSGVSIYSIKLPKFASYVFGSESHGISQKVSNLIESKLSIPNFRKEKGAESLNVASAVAIFLSEIIRDA